MFTAGDTHVPSLGVRGRYDRSFSMKTERKQMCNDVILTALSYLPDLRGEMSATRLATMCGTI